MNARLKNAVLMALRGVVDPEVGLDVVAMGLVYGIDADAETVTVSMTLTSRGCPLGATMEAMAVEALEGVAGERRVALKLVWEPGWRPEMISAEGRAALQA